MNRLIGKAQYYAGHEADIPLHLEQGSLWVAMDTGKLFLYDRFQEPHQIIGSGWDQVNEALTPEQEATLSHFIYDENTNKLVADVSIETILSSLYLGQAWKLSSAGDTVCFVTEELNHSHFPIYYAFKDQNDPVHQDSTGFDPAVTITVGDYIETPVFGAPASSGFTNYVTSGTTTDNVFVFNIEVIIEERIVPGDTLLYEFYGGSDASYPLIYEQRLTGLDLYAGDTLKMNFSNPLQQVAGSTVSTRLTFVPVGEAVGSGGQNPRFAKVRPVANDANQHYSKAGLRFYESKAVATEEYVDSAGMNKAIYDPNNVEGDVFSMDNMVESSSLKIMTNDERNQIEDNRLHNETQDTAIALNTAKVSYPGPQDISGKQDILAEGEFVDGDKTKLDQQSGTNTGDQDLSGLAPISHTHAASEVTDFDTEVANNTAVAANTAKVSNIAHPLVETAVPVGAVFTDTVYDDTDIQAEVDLNTAKVSYPGPQDISGKADKTNVLELDNTDAFTPDADYEPATKKYVDDNTGGGLGYVLATWGANIQTLGRHPAINSPSNAAEIVSLGIMASMPVPATGTIDTIAYYNNTGDNTTTFQIIKNGQVAHTFTCIGPYGAETGINLPIGFAGIVPDNIAIRYFSGTAPGQGLYTAYVK